MVTLKYSKRKWNAVWNFRKERKHKHHSIVVTERSKRYSAVLKGLEIATMEMDRVWEGKVE